VDLALLGSISGGLGVFGSLVYLRIQIRQNSKPLQSSSYHQAVEQM